GPMVVTRGDSGVEASNLRSQKIAIPGTRTSAWLALQLHLREQGESAAPIDCAVVPFDQIIPRVSSGEFAAGLIIHEGQLTYADAGLRCVVDLGKWWKDT